MLHGNRQSAKSISREKVQVVNKADNKEPVLHKILRLYKPKIMNFKDRSKIRRYTTESIAVKRSKEKMLHSFKLLNQTFRKVNHKKKEVEEQNFETIIKYEEIDRPAVTFGEKLWKLNEISVLNLF